MAALKKEKEDKKAAEEKKAVDAEIKKRDAELKEKIQMIAKKDREEDRQALNEDRETLIKTVTKVIQENEKKTLARIEEIRAEGKKMQEEAIANSKEL